MHRLICTDLKECRHFDLTNLCKVAAVSPRTVSSPGDCRVDETGLAPLRHRKAPPIDPFSAEGLDEQWDKWLLTFERPAEWNNWSDTECLLQQAGHLRGKARQEFSLLTPYENYQG